MAENPQEPRRENVYTRMHSSTKRTALVILCFSSEAFFDDVLNLSEALVHFRDIAEITVITIRLNEWLLVNT